MFLACLETKSRKVLKLLLAIKQKNKCTFYNPPLIALDQFTEKHMTCKPLRSYPQ